MKLKIVKVGSVSRDTKGPPGFNWWEMKADGVHCDTSQLGPFKPTTMSPVPPGYCRMN